MLYTELQVTTNFSFLRGASHPEEMVEQAAVYGYTSIAITDHNTLAGIVRAHAAARKFGITVIPGCQLDLLDGPSLIAFPTDLEAYSRLSNLLTVGNLRTEKGKCDLYKADVYKYGEGMQFIALMPEILNSYFDFDESFKKSLSEYKDAFGDNLSLAVSRRYNGDDAKFLYRVRGLSRRLGAPMVATNDVHYHHPQRRELQDIVTCVREKCTIHNAGYRLYPNAERYLKPNDEMIRLFRQFPDAIWQTQRIAEACTFSLDQLKYRYPKEITTNGRTPQEELTVLTWEGAHKIFGEKIPEKVVANIEYELKFIGEVNYSEYF